MPRLKVLLSTFREAVHQKKALDVAPAGLDIEICSRPTRDELARRLPHFDVLITERQGEVDAAAIAGAGQLRLIQRLGRMTHDIDLEAAKRAGIPVCNWPLQSCAMVAEHTMMQLLTLAKRFRECEDILRQEAEYEAPPRKCDGNYFLINWTGRRNIRPVIGSTIGIVGFGEVGGELAMRLKPFGCRILYNKRTRLPAAVEEQFGISYADSDSIRAESDFLCLLLPHIAGEEPPIGRDFIAGMKDGACLISAGSSSTLNEAAVAEAFRDGKLSGVATDGWAWEPLLPGDPLLELAERPDANIAFTPHTAGGSLTPADISANRRREWQNVERLMKGEPLINRVV